VDETQVTCVYSSVIVPQADSHDRFSAESTTTPTRDVALSSELSRKEKVEQLLNLAYMFGRINKSERAALWKLCGEENETLYAAMERFLMDNDLDSFVESVRSHIAPNNVNINPTTIM